MKSKEACPPGLRMNKAQQQATLPFMLNPDFYSSKINLSKRFKESPLSAEKGFLKIQKQGSQKGSLSKFEPIQHIKLEESIKLEKPYKYPFADDDDFGSDESEETVRIET